MKKNHFLRLNYLSSHRRYIFYSMAFGLSSLILPFGIQYLVNNLALSGIWFNTITFLIVIGLGLLLSLVVRFSQIILMETLQREIFVFEISRWKSFKHFDYSHYFFEIPSILKSFSKAYSHLIELGLLLFFGLTTIVLFHPSFILIPLLLGLMIYLMYRKFDSAIETSIQESNEKYKIYDQVSQGKPIIEDGIYNYLNARNSHFYYTKQNTLIVSILTLFCQILLLGFGSYLIQNNQLSVGQLVSAEIIMSGIFFSMLKLPQTLEAIFDYETSQYKISKALVGGKE